MPETTNLKLGTKIVPFFRPTLMFQNVGYLQHFGHLCVQYTYFRNIMK